MTSPRPPTTAASGPRRRLLQAGAIGAVRGQALSRVRIGFGPVAAGLPFSAAKKRRLEIFQREVRP